MEYDRDKLFATAILETMWRQADEPSRAVAREMRLVFLDPKATDDERQAAVSTAIMALELTPKASDL